LKHRPREWRATAAIYATTIVLMLLFTLFLTEDRPSHNSAYSEDWDDISVFRGAVEASGYETECIMSNINLIGRVEDPGRTLLIAAGVELAYTGQEADNIVDFVDRGGRLLVMDDFSNGNSLGKFFGVEFTGLTMWQRDYQRNASFAVVSLTLDGTNYNVTLDAPTTLSTVRAKATGVTFQSRSLIFSSRESWEDTNRNHIVDADDHRGPFLLGQEVSSTNEKNGRAIFISDPDFMLNGMWNLSDNAGFSMALVRFLLPGGGTIIFDESRHLHETHLERGFQTFLRFFVSFSVASHFIIRLMVMLIVGNIALFSIYLTPVPHFRTHRFNVIYDRPPPGEPSPVEMRQRLRKIVISRIKNAFHLFVDAESMVAYDINNVRYDLRSREDLMGMIGDRLLVEFLLNPGKHFPERELREIALRIEGWNIERH